MRTDKTVYEFEWDRGNIDKNTKHKVEDRETEEVFLDENKVIYRDILHSEREKRFVVLGKTRTERLLYVVFTKRSRKIRIISARDINRKEVPTYEKAIKNS